MATGMHPRRSGQEVLLCDLCETVPLQSHCELCDISLCKACVGEHLSDSSERHKVVPFLQRKSTPSYPKCTKHREKTCQLHCKECDIPVCIACITSGQHKGHDILDFLEKLSAKTQSLQNDLKEFETRIYPRYKKMASDVLSEQSELERKYGNLIIAADQQGEMLHREIIAIVNQQKSAIQEMKNKHLSTLDKNRYEITQKVTELKQIIADMKSILQSNDVSLTSTYKSRNSEFRTLPPKVRVTLPSFSPGKINKDRLNEMFGSLSSLSITEEQGETMNSPEAVSSPPGKPMLDKMRLIATIETESTYSFSCFSEDQVWIRGERFLTLRSEFELLQSIEIRSSTGGIAMTRGGNPVYTDTSNKTINLVKNNQTRTMITLQGWRPLYICSTASDDLLVTMISVERKQTKVVRYSGSIKTQTIQFDDQGHSLYSYGYIKHISENRNLDICVADFGARAVVVVNQSGKRRFRYPSHPCHICIKGSFYPYGITTDSQSHILAADFCNNLIHIIDQDGQFLRYLHNLRSPLCLSVDSRDNLFVKEYGSAEIKKIQYLHV